MFTTATYLVSLAYDATIGGVEFATFAGPAVASRGVMCFVSMPVVGAIRIAEFLTRNTRCPLEPVFLYSLK